MVREPPQPTDLASPKRRPENEICAYCLDTVEDTTEHRDSCEAVSQVTRVVVNGEFGIVVPEESGYIWSTKTKAFAVQQVAIQGTYIPIGSVEKTDNPPVETEPLSESSNVDIDIDIDVDDELDGVDNSKEIQRLLRMGIRESGRYDYGKVDLGEKLINERLDGVYADDDEIKQQKARTRDSRITDVWQEINDELPFTYQRVAAPEGYPRTCEGMRWITITGHNHPDLEQPEIEQLMFRKPWVESLIDNGPVALYYPNSD